MLLPTELLLPRDITADKAAAYVNRTVAWYDARPAAYARLAARIRSRAVETLHPPDRSSLLKTMSACC